MIEFAWSYWSAQLELAGFPPHVVVFQATDMSRTIFGQLQLMGDRGV